MILQAAGLALLAALSPTALLVGAVYLGSARPRLVGALYLAGAILMSLVMGLVVIVILRNAGLNLHRQHSARYGLRLGIGILMLAAGAVLAKRFGVEAAQDLVPWHPTLGDVDSLQALEDYQAAKRAHKAEWSKMKAYSNGPCSGGPG